MRELANFEILRKDRPILADLGGFAEQYAHSDPSSALVKLRSLAEQLTKAIYWELRLEKPDETDFVRYLTAPSFRQAVPEVICSKLHAIRKEGNKAAHGGTVESKHAMWILQETFEVSAWFTVRCLNSQPADIPAYQTPSESKIDVAALKAEKKDAQSKLDAALEELDKVKAEYEAVEVKAESQAKGQGAADALQYDEATTRKRLIDVTLAEAGWDVSKSEDVTIEEEVKHQPTTSGIGYIDYVLWDDNGKPLAVVEAKKTSVSEQQGKKQAELYADGLEKVHGQRPIIFYTNGYNIWIWDDAQGYPPRKLFGFYSKSSLQNLVTFQRNHKLPLDSLSPDPNIAGRIYQVEAVKRVCETFTGKRRKALIVQATGTGKTRVAISLSELLVRAKWAKRVLIPV
jgi:type I restriction enzyme R subunit